MLAKEIQEFMGDELRVKITYDEKSYISGIVYKNDELYINYFYVDPVNRGKGIGSKLLKEIIRVSKEYNIEQVSLTDESANLKKKIKLISKYIIT
jgi:GNAT superfamily N-acetyltransferase